MLYLAAVLIVASVALFVAAPLGGGLLAHRRRAGGEAAEAERLEHERALAMQGLRELEFDREMGKLSEADYAALREGLMARALGASAALERLRASAAAPAAEASVARPRLVKSAPAAAVRVRFCPQCGVATGAGNFCSECGAPLSLSARAAARAER